ncbi:MAG: hypothetical protein C4330_09415 [Chitinophagaceae bacterium]
MTASQTSNFEPQTSKKLGWLRFLSRLAFLCNVVFLIAVTLSIFNWLHNEDLTSLIVIVGYLLVLLFNPLVNFCYLILFLIRRRVPAAVPSWLITANLIFLILQLIYILYLNDKSHS